MIDYDNGDRDFLLWLHDRIVNVYGEDEDMDFMWALRSIIARMPPDRNSTKILGWTRQQLENKNENSN